MRKHIFTEVIVTVYCNGEPEAIVTRLVDLLPPASHILDLGCGEGRNAITLAKAGHHVEGRDNAEGEIRALKKHADAASVRVETVCTDLRNLRIGYGKWRAVLAVLILHQLPKVDGQRVHHNVQINLLSGGYIALVAMTSNGDLPRIFKSNFYPSTDELLSHYAKWEILTNQVDVVPCKTLDTPSGLTNERLTLLARKPSSSAR